MWCCIINYHNRGVGFSNKSKKSEFELTGIELLKTAEAIIID